jgi:hypothetical protein
MSFQRSSRTVNTSRTVAQKRLKENVTTPFVTPARVLVPAEEYAHVVTPSFNPTHIDFPDVHGEYYGECSGGSGNDPPR